MSHVVKCAVCGQSFDRDKEPFAQVSARRYAHALCVQDHEELKIFDPTDTVTCRYCKKPFSKKENPDYIESENGSCAHKVCYEAYQMRDKSDEEILNEYIMILFGTDFINPRIHKQINTYIETYGFTYSGILKTLKYFYEIRGNPIGIYEDTIAIVPYVYKEAYRYFYRIYEANEKNKNVIISNKEDLIFIERPKREKKKNNLFKFLDEE